MAATHTLEHGSSRAGRWLRQHRLRITLWIAAFEGLLYLFGVLHWWAAVALAIIAVGFWWYVARSHASYTLRQAGWIFAATQLLVICVPLALGILKTVAVAVIVLLAIAALVLLFTERS
jgi:hypothetical protein